MSIESFNTTPLQDVIPSYLYQQYSDDSDLQAFVAAYNSIAQGYVDWFNSASLALYTSSAISGPLLDWIGQGIYNIARPVISTSSSKSYGAMNTVGLNTLSLNTFKTVQSGTAQIASNDIYKRLMTWVLYRGDGRQSCIAWLKRRIGRFLYGANGSDFDIGELQNISVDAVIVNPYGATNTVATNTLATNGFVGGARGEMTITIPSTSVSTTFKTLFDAGLLPAPFQISYSVVIA